MAIIFTGDVYKTRELTPFLECVDQSPMVRSVLPKLLMQYRCFDTDNSFTHLNASRHLWPFHAVSVHCYLESFACTHLHLLKFWKVNPFSLKQVKKHIQSYLENLENKLLDKEDRTELYRLFVNCFQVCHIKCLYIKYPMFLFTTHSLTV